MTGARVPKTSRPEVHDPYERRQESLLTEVAELLRSLLWGLFNESRLTGQADEAWRRERTRRAAAIVAKALP